MVASTFFCGVSPAWAAKPVTGWVARSTGAQSVALIEGEKTGTWIDLNGGGILEERPTTETARTTHGGRLIWEETRFAEDPEGGTHVFHQQRYIPGIRSYAAGLRIPSNGFQLRGSSIGFHSDETGHLFGIAGTRFEDIKVVIKPAIVTARGALESAISDARGRRSDVVFLESLDERLVKRLLESAEIELASTGDGKAFGYLWSLKVATTRGSLLSVELDAATGEVLSVFDGRASSTCSPSSNNEVDVDGRSQLGGIITDLPATEADNLEPPWSEFTREAHRVAGGPGYPEIIVYLGEDENSDDQCPSEDGSQYFRVFPLQTTDGTTWYDNWNVGGRTIVGRSAADAMLHTIQTMDVFRRHGWNSYDGVGGTTRISVDSFCSNFDNAFFDTGGNSTYFPRDGVGICRLSPNTNWDHQASAGLDVVAHEWAHGVMIHSTGQPYSANRSLHEGFCDMVGYAVDGPGDWKLGEDLFDDEKRLRQVDVDDDDDLVPQELLSFHRCDFETAGSQQQDPEFHEAGNKLAVAFRMMALGVENPMQGCSWLDYCSDEIPAVPQDICSSENNVAPAALGSWHAFSFLFNLFVSYAPASVDWVDLQNLAILAGRNGVLGKSVIGPPVVIGPGIDPPCIEYGDLLGLESARDALLAIGYPPSVMVRPCE